MSDLPPLPAVVVADAVDTLPGRLRRRLDQTLQTARLWPVTRTETELVVTVDAETVVRVSHAPATAEDLRCTCLLAPRCLHRAAVASLAPPADEASPTPSEAVATQPSTDGEPVTAEEMTAAEHLWTAAVAVLTGGVPGAGAVPQAALLRTSHQARTLRLYRAATAAVRVVEHLRAAHREDPAFRLGDLLQDLRELLTVSHALRKGLPWRGTARRDYHLVGNVRLYGLCCEPLVTASGYAGVVTHLVDPTGRLWQIADVSPGGVERATHAPDTPISVGDARLTYRQLARGGLLTTDLHASADGRIGTGKAVRAVRVEGADWYQPPLAQLWDPSLAAQIRRYDAQLDLPFTERPGGHDLIFVDGDVAGVTPEGVSITVDHLTLTVVAAHHSPQLPYVDNLRLLGTATGAPVRLIGRPAGPRRIAAIAASGDWLPGRFQGRVDLGVDRLQRGDLPDAGEPTAVVPTRFTSSPPLHLLTRRLERALEGGRAAVPGDPADADRLRALALPTAAELVDGLESACRVSRDAFGRAEVGSADDLAHAWLAAAVYVDAASRSAELEHWSADPSWPSRTS
jgi:hypothetical protein